MDKKPFGRKNAIMLFQCYNWPGPILRKHWTVIGAIWLVGFSYWPLYLSEAIIFAPMHTGHLVFRQRRGSLVILALVNTRKWRNRSRLPQDEIIELLTKLKTERNKCKNTHKILLDGDQLSVAHNVPATIRLFQPDSEAIFCLVLNHSQESFILFTSGN